jgi:hypothetical protein
VPLQSEQVIAIDFIGPSLLRAEGLLFSSVFAGLDFSLHKRDQEIDSKSVWSRLQTSGLSSTLVSIRRFNISEQDDYQLQVLGISNLVSTKKLASHACTSIAI